MCLYSAAVALLQASVGSIDIKQWYTFTKQLQETLLQLVCSFAKVAAREIGRSLLHPPPTTTAERWCLLAKLTPNMTARLMRCGCRGFVCGALSRAACQPRFYVGICVPLATLRTHTWCSGDRFNQRVQDVTWPDSVVCLEFSVAFEQQAIGGA